MPYFILHLNYVQGGSENKSRNTILTDQILMNVIIFLFCEDKKLSYEVLPFSLCSFL